ncbi:hypothetical protein BBD40_23705 [Paenibacillus ihbetae]|uniref:Uncharacterized protein n=1 Tax=Paenibacillus ihbetae TaxID=1870820 RepID=A0ABX3JPC1_9BACL|nr:hypothetical protein BBD40_23705 [Paenibacillus ihbetae]
MKKEPYVFEFRPAKNLPMANDTTSPCLDSKVGTMLRLKPETTASKLWFLVFPRVLLQQKIMNFTLVDSYFGDICVKFISFATFTSVIAFYY